MAITRAGRRDNPSMNEVITQLTEQDTPLDMDGQGVAVQESSNRSNGPYPKRGSTFMTKIWGQPKNAKPIKEKFDVPIGYKEMILKSISIKWRGWKSTLKHDFYDPQKKCPTPI
ncbi:hypothetical protein M9H77_29521 [Catharanthus roseus]|uniref:Uncharacterized protein n=1 Tax=Catharanthus roseus TaxID=4058 RepID=A0ACB9ZWL2_CATRO|nr:hypothetical protein M9H77_29521 [Catharanthus roseus]